jgi:hypothetical protein
VTRIPPPRRSRQAHSKSAKQTRTAGSLTIKMAGRDDAPLSVAEFKETLYATIRLLEPFSSSHRIKRAALYLTSVDEHGTISSIGFDQEITLRPYDCAADTFDTSKR